MRSIPKRQISTTLSRSAILSVHRHLVAILVKLLATCDAISPDEKLVALFPRSYSGAL